LRPWQATISSFLGLDEQLLVSKRTLATYAESVRIFELRFKYGQVSQMTVEQARSQYETAAAAIPQIETQIAQTRTPCRSCSAGNPGPIQRGKTIYQLVLPAVPAGLPSDLLSNRPDIREAEQNLISANAQIGAARALYLSNDLPEGNSGYASADLSDLSRLCPHLTYGVLSQDRSSLLVRSPARYNRQRQRRGQHSIRMN